MTAGRCVVCGAQVARVDRIVCPECASLDADGRGARWTEHHSHSHGRRAMWADSSPTTEKISRALGASRAAVLRARRSRSRSH